MTILEWKQSALQSIIATIEDLDRRCHLSVYSSLTGCLERWLELGDNASQKCYKICYRYILSGTRVNPCNKFLYPNAIFNVNEKDPSLDYKTPLRPQALTSGKLKIITVIGAGTVMG